MKERYVCIHGHFYQPPRENPWLEAVELQDSAYPYHDWNARITEECYAPNTASRIMGPDGKIAEIVNNYSMMSFNFGPTLLAWLKTNRPAVYRAVLDADRLSITRFSGHGSAMAQAYNHMIMPLANKRDRKTQVAWGVRDFSARFNRAPDGMWLPETAVDTPTLEALAEAGIKFTVLSQKQARRVRALEGDTKWTAPDEAGVDPTMPYLVRLPSGLTISVFFYDGPIAHDVSFGGLLGSGLALSEKLVDGFSPESKRAQLMHIATDGENYGHHHRYGDMALAYCLRRIESLPDVELANYASFLAANPPTHEVEVHENSSWSCVHGVERWRDDCGCTTGAHHEWNQAWRAPLREALDTLSDRLAALYEEKTSGFFEDPWKARDSYIDVMLARSAEKIEEFISANARPGSGKTDIVSVLKLLEMQRNAMLMYTSCGWFFEEISGIETVQVMQYAAHAIQYAEELGAEKVEEEFLKILGSAPSNVLTDGAAVYEKHVRPATVDLPRVGAHYAMSSIFEEYNRHFKIFCYSGEAAEYKSSESGKTRLAIGRATFKSHVTLESKELVFGALYLGEQGVDAWVSEYAGAEIPADATDDLNKAQQRGDTAAVIRRLDGIFGPNNYSIWHLFRDEQRKIISRMLEMTYQSVEASYRHIYEENYGMMNFLIGLGMPVPRPLGVAASYIVNLDLKRILTTEEDVDIEKFMEKADLVNRWSLGIDPSMVEYHVSSRVNSMMGALSNEPGNTALMEKVEQLLKAVARLDVKPDLWEAQNICFRIGKLYQIGITSAQPDTNHARWLETFTRLGDHLGVRVG